MALVPHTVNPARDQARAESLRRALSCPDARSRGLDRVRPCVTSLMEGMRRDGCRMRAPA